MYFTSHTQKKVNVDLSIEEENALISTISVIQALLDKMKDDGSETVLTEDTLYANGEIELTRDFLIDLLTPMWYYSEEKIFKEHVKT